MQRKANLFLAGKDSITGLPSQAVIHKHLHGATLNELNRVHGFDTKKSRNMGHIGMAEKGIF